MLAAAYCVRQHPVVTFWRRLTRDLREHRKPPLVLVRRGLALLRDQRRVVAHAVAPRLRGGHAGRGPRPAGHTGPVSSFWPVRLAQPDRRTCGPSVLVSLLMLESEDYRERVLRGGPEAARARFAAEVLGGAPQHQPGRRLARAPPAALGARPRHRARGRWPGTSGAGPATCSLPRRRAAAYDLLVSSLRPRPHPGLRRQPLDAPARRAGRRPLTTASSPATSRRRGDGRASPASEWLDGRLEGCGGWRVPWAVVTPLRRQRGRGRRTPA